MVCRPDTEEEEHALCVIRDFTGTSNGTLKETFKAPPSMTGKEFVRAVANIFSFEPYSFRLVAPASCKEDKTFQLILTEDSEELLKDLGVNFESGNRNLFVVEGLVNKLPLLISKDDDLELGASASPEEPSSSNSYSPPLTGCKKSRKRWANDRIAVNSQSSKNSPAIKYDSQVRRNDFPLRSYESSYSIGFRGLINQAMTCYLNSLLQALFMTPEFRNALYNWKFVPTSDADEYKSIPFQLQKLFLNLQTSSRLAVETTDLTRSFGWDSSEAWQQHDIQELCRVMFDALEQEFKGTEQADLINRLYQGKMIDYVKCLECGTEKSREDTFLDIPLPVRPFGSNVAYGSVEEALSAFVRPETLEENNQYFCERCNKKCNAHKGLKFTKFPYLLTLHLMRFDFDYNTMHRIKLSDKVVFPETLNLNNFISETSVSSTMYKEEGSEGFPEEIAGSSSKCDDSSTTDSGSAIDDENCLASSNDLNNVDYEQDVDEGIDVGNQHENEKNRNHSMDAGPYVYELFSIMVHSGSASGGHYYVYIKDFCTGEWFCFNDQQVTRITTEDIDRSFGGYGPSRGYYSGVYSSSMNAYMLMYRQIDRERNVLPLREEEFPPHIKALLKKMDEKAEFDRKLREKQKEMHKIKVFVWHPILNKIIDAKCDCNTGTPLKEVTQIAYKKLQLENVVPLNCCRLVLYNSQNESVENCLEDKEMDDIGSIFDMIYTVRKPEMLMDIREPDKPFCNYKSGAVSIRLHLVNLEEEIIKDAKIVRTSLNSPLSWFRDELYDRFKKSRSHVLYIMLQTEIKTEKFLEDENAILKALGVVRFSKVFVCFTTNSQVTMTRTKLRSLISRYLNTVKVNVMLPDIKPEVFKRLSIPSLSEYSKNRKPEESYTVEKDSCHLNGSLGNLVANNNVLPPLLSTPVVNGDDSLLNESNHIVTNAIPVGGHQSDQSASEDSSLTDSDRTIIGDTQEDAQEDCWLSSPGSSPRAGDVQLSTYLAANEENYEDTCPKNECEADLSCDFYFKEISNTVSYDKRKNLKIEVDKRMPINTFKKHLEPYVQVPRPYFKLCTDSIVQGDTDTTGGIYVASLAHIEDDATLHVRLGRPSKSGIKARVFHLKLSAVKMIRFLGEFDIDEESTVAETKKELLQDLRVVQNIDIPFERCRLRKRTSNGPGAVCLNDQVWKDLNIGYDNRQLYLQELDVDEPITDPESQTCVMIRNANATAISAPLCEVVLNELTVAELKAKVSEISGIPEENLVLGVQWWSNAVAAASNLHTSVNNCVDIDWTSVGNATVLNEWPVNLKEEGHIINYKDDRKELNETKAETKYLKSRFNTNQKLEKSLKIYVGGASKVATHGEVD